MQWFILGGIIMIMIIVSNISYSLLRECPPGRYLGILVFAFLLGAVVIGAPLWAVVALFRK